jgi:hypothetical protein
MGYWESVECRQRRRRIDCFFISLVTTFLVSGQNKPTGHGELSKYKPPNTPPLMTWGDYKEYFFGLIEEHFFYFPNSMCVEVISI